METNDRNDVRVSGIGITSPTATDPALGAQLDWEIVLTVSDADGSPVAGLSADAFSVAVVGAGRTGYTTPTSSPGQLNEPIPGVYVFGLERRATDRMAGSFACVVDVHVDSKPGVRASHSPGRARVLVPMGH